MPKHWVLPLAGLVATNVVFGRALAANKQVGRAELGLVKRLQRHRAPAVDKAALTLSAASDVPAAIAHGAVAVGAVFAVSRDWRRAAAPALALSLETVTYLIAGAAVRRDRPTGIERLDHDQPTSSFPSGHVGGAVALMVVYARLSREIKSPALAAAARAACLAYPIGVGWSRVHVGMHYPTDVAMGAVNGLVAGLLAAQLLGRADH